MSISKDSWNVKGKQGSGKKVGKGRKRNGKEKEGGSRGKRIGQRQRDPFTAPTNQRVCFKHLNLEFQARRQE